MVILPVGHIRAVLKLKNNIPLMVTVYIALFEAIGELERETLRNLRAAVFSWNGQLRGQQLQAKS